jgi:Ca2+-binding EF-hand superfamily protein
VMEKLQQQRDSEAEMHKAFLYFSNGHDRITLSDLRKVSLDIPDEQTEQVLREMLTVADRDGDGVVTFQDFRNMMVQCIQYEAEGLDNPRKIIDSANIRDGVRL